MISLKLATKIAQLHLSSRFDCALAVAHPDPISATLVFSRAFPLCVLGTWTFHNRLFPLYFSF